MATNIINATGVWLQRIGNTVRVLVEIDREWRLAIEEHADGNFSHIAEPAGAYRWPIVDMHEPIAP